MIRASESEPDFRNAAVTFATYLDDGRLQLQMRGFVSPEGRPVSNAGLLSINGGHMETGDQRAELIREVSEELGIQVELAEFDRHFAFLGDVRERGTNRVCHVYRVLNGYQTLLSNLPAAQVIRALLEPEGMGRAFVWRDELEALIVAERLTSISVQILRELPMLWPVACR